MAALRALAFPLQVLGLVVQLPRPLVVAVLSRLPIFLLSRIARLVAWVALNFGLNS